jgi:crystallin alpha B
MRFDPWLRTPQQLFSQWFNLMDQPLRIFDQNFGNGLFEDDLIPSPMYNWPMSPTMGALAARRASLAKDEVTKSGISEILYDKDKYQVMLDVKHFKPEEISVKSNEDSIIIHGHHSEKPDEHGYISRSFTRRYVLPEDIKTEHVECNLSSDGVLTLKAPRIIALKDDTERVIPVLQTGKPALKEQPKEKPKETTLHIMAAPPAPPAATDEKGASCGEELRKGGSA